MVIISVVTTVSVVDVSRCFGWNCCIHLQGWIIFKSDTEGIRVKK